MSELQRWQEFIKRFATAIIGVGWNIEERKEGVSFRKKEQRLQQIEEEKRLKAIRLVESGQTRRGKRQISREKKESVRRIDKRIVRTLI